MSDAGAQDGDAAVCPNCGSARSDSFCPRCGQKAMPLAPTLGYFLHELTHELVHVDGKIFRSLRLLLTRPGFLTREIFAGRRASYISPVRLYLIASILAFAIGAAGTDESLGVAYTPSAAEAAAPADDLPGLSSSLSGALGVWLPRAMFVLVPLFAALVMLFRRGSGHTYPQHLYFALHVHAAWFFAIAVDSAFEALVPVVAVAWLVDRATELYMVGYLLLAFHRVYETTLVGTLWRAASIGALYLIALLLAMISIVAPAVWPLVPG